MFETTGDGVPDYVVGISNDAPRAGDFRVWVTDLVTGTTQSRSGPPYGYPVEFGHPDEWREGDPLATTIMFTFLTSTGTLPPGIDLDARYYAWASQTENGQVVAWDYAPDFGWLERGDP